MANLRSNGSSVAALCAWGLALAPSCGPTVEQVDASVCHSEMRWSGGDSGDDDMHPGDECISCHRREGGPSFSAAGTVFGQISQATDCFGLGGAVVEITDANQRVFSTTTGEAGNFSFVQPIATPYTAAIVYDGQRVQMASQQETTDCNSCHTQSGAEGTLGRLVPLQFYEAPMP